MPVLINKPSSFSYTTNAILAGMAIAGYVGNIGLVQSFQYTKQEPDAYECLKDNDLTKMCMSTSEKSLADDWENEDDDHWASFEPIP